MEQILNIIQPCFFGSRLPQIHQGAVADFGPFLAGEKQRENRRDEVSNEDHVSHLEILWGPDPKSAKISGEISMARNED